MGYATLRFPASLAAGGLTKALVSGGALLAYAVASEWAKRSPSNAVQSALRSGARVGVVLGTAALMGHTLEVFAPSGAHSRHPGSGNVGPMFLLLGVASAETYRREASIRLGIMSSIWGAMISSVATVVFAFAVGLLFMSQMQRVLSGALAVSGMTDARAICDSEHARWRILAFADRPGGSRAYGCRERACRSSMLKIGTPSHSRGARDVCPPGPRWWRRRPSICVVARAVREAPFVMLGLLLLGAAMTSAGPVFAVIRDPKTVS